MTFTLKMDATGLDGVVDRIADLGGRAENLDPLWDQLYRAFLIAEEARFQTQGSGHWAPNQADTQQRKIQRGQDPRTLRATGSLYRSLTSPSAANAVLRKTRSSVEFGTSVEHAQYQQHGKGRRERMVIVVSDRMRREFAEAVARWIAEG